MKLKLTLAVIFCTTFLFGQNIPPEKFFFNGSVPNKIIKLDPVNSTTLQDAIDKTSANGGGRITIPPGYHTLARSVSLKSNVHIIVDSKANLKVPNSFNGPIFNLGETNTEQEVSNVKIASNNGRKFTVDYSNIPPERRVFVGNIGYITNFSISNVNIVDNKTLFSAFRIGPKAKRGSGKDFETRKPSNGIIKNCSINNANYGYGLVQFAGGKNMLFRNLRGVGGVTLRMEGSATGLKEAGFTYGNQENIYGDRIRCRNGNAAVMISPHAKKHGKVLINDVVAVDCGIGIRVDPGFGKVKGFYSPKPIFKGTIRIIKTGKKVAQIKQKHYVYYPVDFIKNNPFNSLPNSVSSEPQVKVSEAIAPILYRARPSASGKVDNNNGDYDIDIKAKTIIKGFGCTPDIVYGLQKNKVCSNNKTRFLDTDATSPKTINLYPQPAKATLTIDHLIGSGTITIYNISGKIVQKDVFNTESKTINTATLTSGSYFLTAKGSELNFSKKILIK
ncbi:T9SS type A sorting domain-containing protein [Aquimarina sp. ERC-38]|uniref:T9SS type A sorting domain-containing protein n=1 Tax=Aquimarina sp. ERC-38 TaxID=2949996 RepID=UPI0022473A12|nr:T9SS type A sorting domain-containing protein [Aquimarina sp. ERC-38]UZO82623.1 T9SS type A sorting domain-containing protein [Aquimarina sp. ERC-38]